MAQGLTALAILAEDLNRNPRDQIRWGTGTCVPNSREFSSAHVTHTEVQESHIYT